MQETIQLIKPFKVIIYDFETTGLLDFPNVQPTELAAQIIDTDGSVKTIHKYIKCPYSIDNIVINKNGGTIKSLTGIDDELLNKEGYDLKDVIQEFESELKACNGTKHFVVGHNILAFDNPLYGMMQEKIGGTHRINDEQCFDTGMEFKGVLMKWKRFPNATTTSYHKGVGAAKSYVRWNLTAAGQHYGIQVNPGKAHAAIVDIQNNLQVFIKQLKIMGKLPENLAPLEL